jgi:O-methyltransferase involved in polyketide biosynthesis
VSVDIFTPNPGRVYDYLLGGVHNFPADREFGEQFKRLLPGYDVGAQRGRQCLCKAVNHLAQIGHKYFIDFASGLPTRDNVHIAAQSVHPDARVIYSDIDPLTMAYSLEILGDAPYVRYIHCDASEPEELLGSSALIQLFGSQRRVAITFMGISYFLPGATVRRALRVLYDWTSPGSHLVLGFVAPSANEITLATKRLLDVYQDVLKLPLHLRTPAEVIALAGHWRVCEPGVAPYDVYLDAPGTAQLDDPAITNIRGHVAFFEK